MSARLQPYLLSRSVVLPEERLPIEDIFARESERVRAQLDSLGGPLRARVLERLGIERVACHRGPASDLGLAAARRALADAHVSPDQVGLILDFSTLPGDWGAWSLANAAQHALAATRAVPMSVHGSGCAGLHLALRNAVAWMTAGDITHCLILAADSLADGQRVGLPISVMGDGASAMVLATCPAPETNLRLLAVETTTLGEFHSLLVTRGEPPSIELDAASFETGILPLHFVMCHRVLAKALERAGRTRQQIRYLVYPNTSELDRQSIVRALGIPEDRLSGPGPKDLGHVFASDLLINWPEATHTLGEEECVVALSVGSGFTWGASVFGR